MKFTNVTSHQNNTALIMNWQLFNGPQHW